MAQPFYIPPQEIGKWSGVFPGWFLGNLWKALNIDLETQPGKILLSKRLKSTANSGTLADLGVISTFLISDADATERFWALSRLGVLHKTASLTISATWSKETATGAPTTGFDMVSHEVNARESRLIVSVSNGLAILNSANHDNAWVAKWWLRQSIESSTNASPINVVITGHGFITGDTIKISGHATNTVANGTWVITRVDADNFTLNSSTGNGVGGVTGTAGYLNQPAFDFTGIHPLDVFNRLIIVGDGRYIHTIDRNDVVSYQKLTLPFGLINSHIMHSKNRVWILCYDKFNMANGAVIEWDGTSDTYLHAHPVNGIAAISGCVYDDTPIVVNEKGEILYYNGADFVYKRDLLIYKDDQFEFVNATADEMIAHRGMMVKDDVILIALGNRSTSLGPSRRMNSGIICYNPRTNNLYHRYGFTQYAGSTDLDFGHSFISKVGALYPVSTGFFSSAQIYEVYTGTTKNHIYLLNDYADSGRGYFITTKIPTSEVEQMWSTLWLKFKKFTDSGNRIFVRARGTDPLETTTDLRPVIATITWVSTTSFTGVIPTGVAVGDEVEILAGDNAGVCTEITVLSATPDGSATITATVDAVPYASTRAALARFDNWKEQKTISSTSITKDKAPIGVESDYLQLKIEMYGKFMQVNQLIIESKTNQKIDR